MYRGDISLQDRLHFGRVVHRLRYLRQGALSRSGHWVTFDVSAQKCPFEAINIINLPKNLEKETTHRYGPNSFKLHRY